MIDLASAIIIAAIWISCGVYAQSKKRSDALWGAFILTVLLINTWAGILVFMVILLLIMM